MQGTTVSRGDEDLSMVLPDDATAFAPPPSGGQDLVNRYDALLHESRLSWIETHRIGRRLGSGGQGVVFLCERLGADQFRLPVALKIFSPETYETADRYDEAMARMARVALRVALIQHDNLIDVHNFVEHNRIRLMEMEWIDGYDLQALLEPALLQRARDQVGDERWDYINDVIVTAGPVQSRIKPGVAIAVLRDILAALSALHREGIVHGDVKPSNLMLKCTGNAKLIDIGSAFEWSRGARGRSFTPAYAAPEVLEGAGSSPRSDLASLGYVLVEMLAGAPPFAGVSGAEALLKAKRTIVERLPTILPEDVACNELLMNLVRGLIAPDPDGRFTSAEDADLVEQGAANFHRQLVHGNLASEYDNEIRVWLEELD
jgi:serine/threonine-protein kinase